MCLLLFLTPLDFSTIRSVFSVGLLLDLNEGTLAVYKNRQRLGIIKDGLSGEYCWVMSIQGASNSNAVQIKRGFFPDSSYECIH